MPSTSTSRMVSWCSSERRYRNPQKSRHDAGFFVPGFFAY